MLGIGDFVRGEGVTVKGDVPGHEFHGNQYSSGGGDSGGDSGSSGGGGSMGDSVANDKHAKANASTTPGKRKMPWEMTAEEYNNAPVVYRGTNPANEGNNGHVYVTPDKSIAASHGKVTSYRLLPGSKVYPDPEVEGEQDKTLNGLQSLKHGSAITHSDNLVPNLSYGSWKHD